MDCHGRMLAHILLHESDGIVSMSWNYPSFLVEDSSESDTDSDDYSPQQGMWIKACADFPEPHTPTKHSSSGSEDSHLQFNKTVGKTQSSQLSLQFVAVKCDMQLCLLVDVTVLVVNCPVQTRLQVHVKGIIDFRRKRPDTT